MHTAAAWHQACRAGRNPAKLSRCQATAGPSLLMVYLDVKLTRPEASAQPGFLITSSPASAVIRTLPEVAPMPTQAAAWLGLAPDDPFGLAALPYCSFATLHEAAHRRVGVRIGDRVLDLTAASDRLLAGRAVLFRDGVLDPFLAAGDGAWSSVRAEITAWLSQDHYREAIEDLLVPVADAELHLPFTVADFVDFYASEAHASNVGQIFRPGAA